MIATITSLVFL
jgi:hypothetical protein